MSSNSQEKNDSSSSDEEIRRRYESKNLSGQKFDSEEDVIEISDSSSGQAIATNEKLMNTSSQVIISDYSSDDTLPLLTRTTDDYGSGNEDKLDLCQTIDLSESQSTQDVLATDSDYGIYQKPFTSPKEDGSASTSFQQHVSEMIAWTFSDPPRIDPDSAYKKAQRAYDRDRYLRGQREKEKEREKEREREREKKSERERERKE